MNESVKTDTSFQNQYKQVEALREKLAKKEAEYKIAHYDELLNAIRSIPSSGDESYQMFYSRVMKLISPYIPHNDSPSCEVQKSEAPHD